MRKLYGKGQVQCCIITIASGKRGYGERGVLDGVEIEAGACDAFRGMPNGMGFCAGVSANGIVISPADKRNAFVTNVERAHFLLFDVFGRTESEWFGAIAQIAFVLSGLRSQITFAVGSSEILVSARIFLKYPERGVVFVATQARSGFSGRNCGDVSVVKITAQAGMW